MALPSGFVGRVVVGGPVAGENWDTGFWLKFASQSTVPTQSELDVAAGAAVTDFITDVWAPSSGYALNTQNGNQIGVSRGQIVLYKDGAHVGSGTAATSPSLGTLSSGQLPAYVSCCVSTRTATAGRSGRGRMYLPWTGGGVAPDFQFSTAAVPNLLAVLKTWINDLASDFSSLTGWTTGTPVVVSQKLGTADTILSLTADTIPDTQHGRNRRVSATGSFTATL